MVAKVIYSNFIFHLFVVISSFAATSNSAWVDGQCVNVHGLGGLDLDLIGWDIVNAINPGPSTNVNSCINHCKASGFSYAGLRYRWCFCGNPTPPDSSFVPKKECNTVCPGNSGQKCGRIVPERLNVYTTGVLGGHQYENSKNSHMAGWTYAGRSGPQYWGRVSSYCLGYYQSPINLDISTAVRGKVWDLTFVGYDLITEENTNLENNGHSVELELNSVPGGAAMMSGGPLAKPYQLLQLHFHWGSSDGVGSEHTINNIRFPLEMHLVHLSSDIEWGVGSATSPVNIPDGLAVAAFIWEVIKNDNPALQPFIERLRAIKAANSETELFDRKFNVASLISPVTSGPYFSYHGSLTTPGCNEVVHWIIFKNTLKLSSRQLAEFRLLMNTMGKPLMDNYRPIQPTNGRVVTLYG